VNGDNMPILPVFFQEKHVGDLLFKSIGECEFTYTESWIKDQIAFPISPHIPFNVKTDSQTIVNFIRNLFPEGESFDTLLYSLNVRKNNLYAVLKEIGKDTSGALTFGKAGIKNDSLREITEEELTQKLDSDSVQELIVWDSKYRLSVAGVQRKLNVLVKDERLFLADGNYSSTHILKFSKPNQKHLIINELICMRLARAAKIDVPDVFFRQFGRHSSLLVTRFDRRLDNNGVLKRHVVDGCQALNRPPEYKYEQNFGSGDDVKHIREGVGINELFSFSEFTKVPIKIKDTLIDWVLFNLIIGNSDAHGKNISFLVSNKGIVLAPFYDLVSISYETKLADKIDSGLAMAIGDNFDVDSITAYDLLSFAENIDFPLSKIGKKLSKMLDNVNNAINKEGFYLNSDDDVMSEDIIYHAGEIIKTIEERGVYFRNVVPEFSPVIESLFSNKPVVKSRHP
jgi:serine/threonine-protein kinase HipA